MNLTLSLNWWQMCLLIFIVMVALMYWIANTAQPGRYCPDIGAMIIGVVVFIGGVAVIIGIVIGKFVFGGSS